MKKLLLIVFVSLLLLGLVSCKADIPSENTPDATESGVETNSAAEPGVTESATTGPDATEPAETTSGLPPVVTAPVSTKEQTVLEYLNYLVGYFHEPYKAGDAIPDVSFLNLMFKHCVHNRGVLDIVDYDDFVIRVKEKDLGELTKKLFGENVNIAEFRDQKKKSTDFDQDTGLYTVVFGTDYWNEDFFFVNNKKEAVVTEDGNTVTVVCETYEQPMQFSDQKSNFRTMKYVFSKTSFEGKTFYKLESVSVEK